MGYDVKDEQLRYGSEKKCIFFPVLGGLYSHIHCAWLQYCINVKFHL